MVLKIQRDGVKNPKGVVRHRVRCFKNGTKMTENGPKILFFEVIEKFGHKFFLDLLYNESLYYLLCTCTNPIPGKNMVLETWT